VGTRLHPEHVRIRTLDAAQLVHNTTAKDVDRTIGHSDLTKIWATKHVCHPVRATAVRGKTENVACF